MNLLNANMKLAAIVALVTGFVGCASDQSTSVVRSPIVQQDKQIYDLETTSLVINYGTAQVLLKQSDKNNISALIDKSRFDAAIDRIDVASWADHMLPDNGAKLSSADEMLATRRIAEIASFLKTKYNTTDVKSFNMAERSNWLARTFSTRDAELKSRFAKDEVAPMTEKDLEVIRANGSESRSVIVITHK